MNGFGGTVAGVGDLNLDGYDDVLIGTLDGPVRFYEGSPTGLTPTWSAGLGVQWVSGAGDVDGDGIPDIAIAGSLMFRVFLGSSAGPVEPSVWQTRNPGDASMIVGAGDLDGNGFADIATGVSPGDQISVYLATSP
jgi:hypothetical protein